MIKNIISYSMLKKYSHLDAADASAVTFGATVERQSFC